MEAGMSTLSVKDLKEKDLKQQQKNEEKQKEKSEDVYVPEEGQEDEIFFEIPPIEELINGIIDEKEPISKRMRCCFLLKQIGGEEAISTLSKGLRSPSVLLAHECAYVMGQLQDKFAIPFLEDLLKDQKANPIIRHECGEALAAIGDFSVLPLLESLCDDSCKEVADTCQIAVEKLKWAQKNQGVYFESKYASVDPAPPSEDRADVSKLQIELMDKTKSMFERYRAMFALREIGTEEAVLALATGFDDESAVFRHEVAYVMGQIQHPAAIEGLKKMLANGEEHPMVRHEAAEALGSIAEDDEVGPVLRQYAKDKDLIVAQSCDVALDLVDYWNNDEVCSALPQEQATA